MLFLKTICFLYFAALHVHADAAALIQAISEIEKATQELAIAVVKWDGFILTALPIGVKSMNVVKKTKKATFAAITTPPLTLLDAWDVGQVSLGLTGDVESMLAIMIKTKPKFKKALLQSFVLGRIKISREQSVLLLHEVVRKLPKLAKGEGRKLEGRITSAFETCIKSFEPSRSRKPEH